MCDTQEVYTTYRAYVEESGMSQRVRDKVGYGEYIVYARCVMILTEPMGFAWVLEIFKTHTHGF